MSATNSFEASVIALIFNATAIANVADNAASSPATSLYVSLYTADPGEAGDQSTSEAAYDGYARVAVDRDSDGWTCSGSQAANTAQITFGQATGGTIADITHVGIGLSSSGTGTLLGSLALENTITMSAGATPIFAAGQLTFTVD
jgi:hypothetical protein